MSSPLRGFSIVMMAVLALTACKRRSEAQDPPGDPATAPATAAAPATPAAAPADAAAAADALPWVTGPACKAGGLDPITDVPCLYTWATPAGPTPLAVHLETLGELRLVAELAGARSLVVHQADVNVARGTRLHLRPQADQRLAVVLVEDWSEDGTEPETAEAWLLGRTGKGIEVTPLDKKKEPWPAWASATAAAATANVPDKLRPVPLPGCNAGLTSPEQVCECVTNLPQDGDAALGGFGCTVQDTSTDSVKLGEVTQEDGTMYFLMHRAGTGWAALFVLGGAQSGGVVTTRFELAATQTRTFGARQALWIETERRSLDAEEQPKLTAETTRELVLCLLGESGAAACVLEAPLSREERRGKLPLEIWASAADPMDHFDELRVVSSYRLKVDVSDDGKATIAVDKGKPPEDVRRLLGTYPLW